MYIQSLVSDLIRGETTDYLNWNDRIAAHFFNEDMAGREVLLYVTREVIEAIGVGDDAGLQDFVEAVKEGPRNSSPGNVCEKALDLYWSFRVNRQGYPPYVAYLALFTYAGTIEIEGYFEDKAYYPRLYKTLGEPIATGSYPSFSHMHSLWEDLERWSKEDKGEQLGRFTFRRRGGWVHVDIPRSQLVLSDEERAHLPLIFYEASLDPVDPPSDLALIVALRYYGQKLLSARTMKLVEPYNVGSRELLAALLDFMLEELANWDGTEPEWPGGSPLTGQPPSAPREAAVSMRICIENIDKFLRTVDCRLRIKTNRQIPEGGLFLDYNGSTYTCAESREPGWTTRVKKEDTFPSTYFDASGLDWTKGATFEDHENNWVVRFKGEPVRLFMQSPLESITGWIEHSQLAYHNRFFVACNRDWLREVETWGETCGTFHRVDVSDLPTAWALLEGQDATKSCPGVDVLTLPREFHLYLQGGVSTGKRNEYLYFAPPTIIITGGRGDEEVVVNGLALEPEIAGTCCWHLWPGADTNTRLEIKARDKESKKVLKRRFIRLIEPFISAQLETTRVVDKFGQILSVGDTLDKAPYVSGAVAYGIYQEEPYVIAEPPTEFYQPPKKRQMEVPAEVSTGPQERQIEGYAEVLSRNIGKSVSIHLKSTPGSYHQVVLGTVASYDAESIWLTEAELCEKQMREVLGTIELRTDGVTEISDLDYEFNEFLKWEKKGVSNGSHGTTVKRPVVVWGGPQGTQKKRPIKKRARVVKAKKIIYVGNESIRHSISAVLTPFMKGIDKVLIKARGEDISRAVTVALIVQRDITVDVKGISISTERLRTKTDNADVSAIEITLEKQPFVQGKAKWRRSKKRFVKGKATALKAFPQREFWGLWNT